MDGQIQPISTLRLSTPLQNCCIGLAIAAFGVIICYFWLDRPLALFLHGNVADKTIFVWLQRVPLVNRPFSRFQSVALTCSISFISTSLINSQLKYAFGRSWPNTWIENNPSLIQNGAFGFNPFHGGPGFASFPSGHAAAICSVMTVLWWSYPNWRPIYVACATAVAVGLIGANYHFLSDILSGMFVGTSVGYITTKMSCSPNSRMDFPHGR
jgi:hypothetical protein